MQVVLNSAGVQELLKSPEMAAICKEYADTAVSRLGDGYGVSVYTGKNRVNVSIYANTYDAIKENLNDNTILRALR